MTMRPVPALIGALLVAALATSGRATAPAYYPDDPLVVDPERRFGLD